MLFQTAAVFATVLLGSVSAQDSSSTKKASSTTVTSAAVVTHTAAVGSTGHHFEPSEIKANVGDIIEFRFYPQNHSVARAAYKQPCIPYEYTGPGRVGFWTGFFPIQLVLPDPPKFQIRVNDTEPIFYYCSAPNACVDGMIGVVNPNATQTFETQHDFAIKATQAFSPGENPFPPEVASSRTNTFISGPTETSPPPAASTTPAPVAAHHSLSPGVIAGIAIAGVFALLLACAVIYMLGRQKTMSQILHRQSAAPNPTVYHPASPGFAEAHYPNASVVKGPMSTVSSGRWSEMPYGASAQTALPTEDGRSYRSASPTGDERTGMIMNPSGFPSPRSEGVGPFPSPGYSTWDERDAGAHLKTMPQPYIPGMPQSYVPDHQNFGPHELPVPSRANSSTGPSSALSPRDRAFSYTDSEVGYAGQQRDTYR